MGNSSKGLAAGYQIRPNRRRNLSARCRAYHSRFALTGLCRRLRLPSGMIPPLQHLEVFGMHDSGLESVLFLLSL
jgi:hypothetical protein